MSTLDDVLSDKPIEKTEAPEAKAEAPEPKAEPDKGLAADGQAKPESRRREHQKKEWEAQGRDPATGQFTPKEKKAEAPAKETPKEAPKAEAPAPEAPKPAAPPQQEMSEKERAAFAAAADERRKRQDLERRLEALEKSQKPAEPAKKFWDDPDGALKTHQDSLREVQVQTRLQTSELIARSKYPDFDDKVAVFADLIRANPGLAPQWLNHAHPAEFAYQTAKNHKEMQEAGGMEAMREKIRAETAAKVRAEVEAEFKAKQEAFEKERAAIPPSLSDVRGATGSRAQAVWGGPRSLTDVLTGKG